MRYSKLLHDIEIMKLNQKHEVQLLKMKQENDLRSLLSKCKHTYEDGSSARTSTGDQRESWSVCGICDKEM